METTNKTNTNVELSSAELGKLWATYMGNSMSKCVLRYFLQHVEDPEIKHVVNHALYLTEQFIEGITEMFIQEKIPIPVGFSEEDVNVDAPRLFLDEFYLHYLKYAGKAGISIYGIAIPLMARGDVRDFFTHCLASTIELMNEINELLITKEILIKSPAIPKPKKVDFIKKKSYFKGFLGHVRPLHALEITHLYDNIQNNATSKAVLIGFSQVAKTNQVKEFLVKGIEICHKHFETFNEILRKDQLNSPIVYDHLVTHSTVAPFSEKLMVAHKLDMFSMRIRTYGNALAVNARHDLAALYAKFSIDVGTYSEGGAQIMMDHGWLEEPPQAAGHD